MARPASGCSDFGPLEGGHSYMLEQAGAAEIDRGGGEQHCATFKCLLVQQAPRPREDASSGSATSCRGWTTTNDTYRPGGRGGRALPRVRPGAGPRRHLSGRRTQVYLWTHYVDFDLMPQTDRRYKRWLVVEEHDYRGAPYPLHRRAYKKTHSDPKFIGGVHTTTAWIEKQTILEVFGANGYEVEIAHEANNHSGPSASFFARSGADVAKAVGRDLARGRRTW